MTLPEDAFGLRPLAAERRRRRFALGFGSSRAAISGEAGWLSS